MLKGAGYDVSENNVILIEIDHKPGILRKLTEKLQSNKIDIVNIYGGALHDGEKGVLVFSTTDNHQAYSLLEELF